MRTAGGGGGEVGAAATMTAGAGTGGAEVGPATGGCGFRAASDMGGDSGASGRTNLAGRG